MQGHAHSDPSMFWLKLFFTAFACSVLAIGLWACFNYDVNKVEAPVAAGGHH